MLRRLPAREIGSPHRLVRSWSRTRGLRPGCLLHLFLILGGRPRCLATDSAVVTLTRFSRWREPGYTYVAPSRGPTLRQSIKNVMHRLRGWKSFGSKSRWVVQGPPDPLILKAGSLVKAPGSVPHLRQLLELTLHDLALQRHNVACLQLFWRACCSHGVSRKHISKTPLLSIERCCWEDPDIPRPVGANQVHFSSWQ